MVTTNSKHIRLNAKRLTTRTRLKQQLHQLLAIWYRAISVCLLAILLQYSQQSFAQAEDNIPRDAMEYFFNQSFNNLSEELEIVAEEKKAGIFIMFSDKDCPWCMKMKATIMSRPDVQKYYREHFRLLTLDISGDTVMTDFAGNEVAEKDFAFKQHRVRATPVFIFFDAKGKVATRFTGITRNAKEFIWLGEFVVSGAYQKTNFSKYKRERMEQEKAAPDVPQS